MKLNSQTLVDVSAIQRHIMHENSQESETSLLVSLPRCQRVQCGINLDSLWAACQLTSTSLAICSAFTSLSSIPVACE
jgi:hypothetical protein